MKVDGFCWASSIVYIYQGFYYQGCYYQHKHVYKDKVTGAEKYANVQIGHLYQATKQKIERLKQSGFKVLEMWVCDCKKNKVNPQRFSFVLSHSISTLL